MQVFRGPSPIPNANADFRNVCLGEPTIGELLADPLTRALMRADRVDAGALERMFRDVAGRLRVDQAPARPAGALNVTANTGLPSFLPRMSGSRVSEPAVVRSAPEALAAMASRIACGSHRAW